MANRKQGEIKITLYSDLCPGNGYSYYGTIDSEAEHDRLGIPYIPARRIKGCLRECAELLEASGLWENDENSKNILKELFGERADDGSKGIKIENAYINNYSQIKEELELLQKGKKLKGYISPEQVLVLFSDVKAQTRMKNGVAEDNSLRYTRIIRQFSRVNKGERLTFIAKVEYVPGQEIKLKKLCKALRHIGMNRNRGLGCVKCEFIEEAENTKRTFEFNQNTEYNKASMLKISVFFKNVEPMIISGDDKNTGLDYIPGKTVLGALAGKYLSIGNTADSEEFMRLFLNGETVYSDFTISDGVHIFDPAPSFLNQLKKSKKYVNALRYSEREDNTNNKDNTKNDYNPANGNQPKKLKGKYTCLKKDMKDEKGNDLVILERSPEKKIIFHHRRGDDALLYSQTALKEGQIFAGTIIVSGKDYKLLSELLNNTDFCFGKSKTAQYGKCRIVNGNVEELPKKGEDFSAKKDELIYVSLVSNGIFQDENGYTQEPEKVYKIIGERLGLLKNRKDSSKTESEYQVLDGEIAYPFCSIQPTVIMGYSAVWNLHKAPIAGIEAGSTFVYKAEENIDISNFTVGERNLDGFGKVHLYHDNELPYRLPVKEEDNNKNKTDCNAVNEIDCNKNTISLKNLNEDVKEILKNILYSALYRNILEEMLLVTEKEKLKMSSSTIGRVTLMVKETMPENEKVAEKKYLDFASRVASIKRDTERGEIEELIEKLFGTKYLNKDAHGSLDINKIRCKYSNVSQKSEETDMLYATLCELTGEDNVKAYICSLWGKLMLEILANQKYLKKFKEK